MTVTHLDDVRVFAATVYWPDSDEVVQYPYHLGTDEDVARSVVVDVWRWRPDRGRKESIALWHEGRVVDYYDGEKWSSDLTADQSAEDVEYGGP